MSGDEFWDLVGTHDAPTRICRRFHPYPSGLKGFTGQAKGWDCRIILTNDLSLPSQVCDVCRGRMVICNCGRFVNDLEEGEHVICIADEQCPHLAQA